MAINNQWGQKPLAKPNSKDVAKERLKLVLMHDRVDISPGIIEMIKNDIKQIISKYIDIDIDELDVELKTMERQTRTSNSAIVANIPIRQNRIR